MNREEERWEESWVRKSVAREEKAKDKSTNQIEKREARRIHSPQKTSLNNGRMGKRGIDRDERKGRDGRGQSGGGGLLPFPRIGHYPG